MAVSVPSGFLVTSTDPIDGRMIAANASARKDSSRYTPFNSFVGLLVYQQDTNELYSLIDKDNTGNDAGWQLLNDGGNGSPGGANTQIQFNSGSSFGGSPKLIFNETTGATTISGSLLISGSNTDDIFLIKSGSIEVAKVDQNGNFILVERTGATPTAVEGGIMYSSSAFYVGVG